MDRDKYLEGKNIFLCSMKNIIFCDKGKVVYIGKRDKYVIYRIYLVLMYNLCLIMDVFVLNKEF